MPGFTGLNFFIVIFQYLSMTQHQAQCNLLNVLLSLCVSLSIRSLCFGFFSLLCFFPPSFTRLSFSFVFLYPSRLHVSLHHLSSLPHPPFYFDMHLLTPSFSLLYICRLYISTAPLYRALSHTQHLYVSLSVSLSTSGFGRRKTAD